MFQRLSAALRPRNPKTCVGITMDMEFQPTSVELKPILKIMFVIAQMTA